MTRGSFLGLLIEVLNLRNPSLILRRCSSDLNVLFLLLILAEQDKEQYVFFRFSYGKNLLQHGHIFLFDSYLSLLRFLLAIADALLAFCKLSKFLHCGRNDNNFLSLPLFEQRTEQYILSGLISVPHVAHDLSMRTL